MHFSDKAFEKAYLSIIKESAIACDKCGVEYDEEGNPVCDCKQELEECDQSETLATEEETEQDIDELEDDAKQAFKDTTNITEEDEELAEKDKKDEKDEKDEKDTADIDTDDDKKDDEPTGKFISFFTTDENLIKALEEGFDTIAITPVAKDDDEKVEPVEFTADLFENLTVEDLKEDNEDTDEVPADTELTMTADTEVPEMDVTAADEE